MESSVGSRLMRRFRARASHRRCRSPSWAASGGRLGCMETSSLDPGVSTTGDSRRLVSWAGTENHDPGQPGLLTVVPLHRPLLPAWVPESSDGTIFIRFHRLSLDILSPSEARPQLGARVQGSEWGWEVFKI